MEVIDPEPREPGRRPAADAPDVGDRAMVPDPVAEALFVEHADMVRGVFGGDIERDLAQKEVRPDPRRGADPGFTEHGVHQRLGKFPRRLAVQLQIGRSADEAFVDGIDVDIVRADVLLIERNDPRGDLHIAAHVRQRDDIVDAVRDLEQPAAVRHAQRFHSGGHGEADRPAPARFVRDHEVGLKRVQPPVDAFDRGKEAFEIDTNVELRHEIT